jgi:hypothetical protein
MFVLHGARAVLDRISLEQTLRALHERRIDVEARLRSAEQRRRFHPHPSAKEQAEERAALVDLDRIMTRIRAAEAKLALIKEGRQPPIG